MKELEFLLDKIDKYFFEISLEAHKEASLDLVGHEYIATPIPFIVNALNGIKERESIENKRFLDVGSGVGNICAVANYLGLNAEGIELNPVLFNISEQIHSNIKIHNLDIRDFNSYENYDLIFYFLPFFDENLQKELKAKIENNCKIGAYIIVLGQENKDDRFVNIHQRQVWQKIKK